MDDGKVYNYTDPLDLAAGIIMILNGIIGIMCNASVIYIFWRAPVERTSFNLICVFRGVCNIVILAWAFLATFVPITFIGKSPYSMFYETLVIGCVNSIYAVIQNTGILIAVNRLCAVFYPFGYQKIFKIKYTFLMTLVIVVWKAFVVIQEFFFYLPRECWMYFSSKDLAWTLSFGEICFEDNQENINKTAIYLGIMVIANLATFSKIYFFYKSSYMIQQRKDGKMRKNRVMFLQTLVQDAIMLIDMLFTFQLSSLSEERYWTFISGTLIWQTVHSLDGFIMILFNERLTFIKKSFFSSSATPSMPNSKVFHVSTTPATHLNQMNSSRSQRSTRT